MQSVQSVTLLIRKAILFTCGLFLLLPLQAYSEERVAASTQTTTVRPDRPVVRRTAPPKVRIKVAPLRATAAGYQQPVCQGNPLPDLEVSDLKIQGSGRNGQPHTATVSIVNRGQCATGVFSVKATMKIQAQNVNKTVTLGTKGARALKPCRNDPCNDASTSVVFQFVPQYNHAFYDITVDVDAANKVNEFRENNNQTRGDLRIQIY